MMPKRSLDQKEIIGLLSKLKEQTPEYPANLLESRKAAFLKQAATLKIQGKGQGGEGGAEGGGSGTGGSSATLGGTAAQGFILQAVIGFSMIAALLLTAFAYREQISVVLRENEVVTVGEALGETQTALSLSTPTAVFSATPVISPSPTQAIPTVTATVQDDTNLNITPQIVVEGTIKVEGTPDGTKSNNGLHLGQTPGTPAAPGQGNPGNVNQPDKPKPDKPGKPEKPERPEKPPKEEKPPKN